MVAHTVPFALEEDGVAVQYPAGRAAEVSALGQVDDAACAVRLHDAYVGIGVMMVADELQGKPLAVG